MNETYKIHTTVTEQPWEGSLEDLLTCNPDLTEKQITSLQLMEVGSFLSVKTEESFFVERTA